MYDDHALSDATTTLPPARDGDAADDEDVVVAALRANVALQRRVLQRLRDVDAQLRYVDSLRCALQHGVTALRRRAVRQRTRTSLHPHAHDDSLRALRLLPRHVLQHAARARDASSATSSADATACAAAAAAATAVVHWGHASTAALYAELKRHALTRHEAWPQPFDAATEAACVRAAAELDETYNDDDTATSSSSGGGDESNGACGHSPRRPCRAAVPCARVWHEVAHTLRAQGLSWCSALACYRRAQELLADRRAYTRDEDALLCELVATHGRCWWRVATRLRAALRVRRTPFQLALRYRDCVRVALFDTHRPVEQTWARLQRVLARRDAQRPPPRHGHLHNADNDDNNNNSGRLCLYRFDDALAADDDAVAYATVLAMALRAPGELPLLPSSVKAALEYGRAQRLFASAREVLYWKVFALLCNMPYAYPQRLDTLAARAPLCYAQLSLREAAAQVRVDVDTLRRRVHARLRRARRDVLSLDYDKLSTELFGHTRCATLIFAEARALAADGTSRRAPPAAAATAVATPMTHDRNTRSNSSNSSSSDDGHRARTQPSRAPSTRDMCAAMMRVKQQPS